MKQPLRKTCDSEARFDVPVTWRVLRCALIVSVCVWITAAVIGCGNARHFSGVLLDASPPGRFLLVPPVAQSDRLMCGPAAAAAVLSYHGIRVDRLKRALGERKTDIAWGAADIVELARSLGLEAYFYKGGPDDTSSNIKQGRPVLVLLPGPARTARYPAIEWFSETAHMISAKAHWVTAVGWTSAQEVVLLDPANGYVIMKRDQFLREWSDKRYLSVLIAPGVNRGPPGDEQQCPTSVSMYEE